MHNLLETMKVIYFLLLALVLPFGVLAQQGSNPAVNNWTSDQDKIDFWASSGWSFSETSKDGQSAIALEAITTTAGQSVALADFDPSTFDPRMYNIPLKANDSVLIQVGDKGTLLFLSTARVDVLFERELLNRAAASKK
jgi:hypothetical protein